MSLIVDHKQNNSLIASDFKRLFFNKNCMVDPQRSKQKFKVRSNQILIDPRESYNDEEELLAKFLEKSAKLKRSSAVFKSTVKREQVAKQTSPDIGYYNP